MATNCWIRRLAAGGSALALLFGFAQASYGQATLGMPGGSICPPCNMGCLSCDNCPPPYYHCQEPEPRISIRYGCPKPVCCPVDLPNWGYFQTCWRPFPYAQTLAHCSTVPGAYTPAPTPVSSTIIPIVPPVTSSTSPYGNAPLAQPPISSGPSGSAYSPFPGGNSGKDILVIPPVAPTAPKSGSAYSPLPGGNSGKDTVVIPPVAPIAPKSGSVYNITPPAAAPPTTNFGTINNPVPVLPPAVNPGGVHSMPLQPSGDLPGQRSNVPQSILRPGT